MTLFPLLFNSYVKMIREQLIPVENDNGVAICDFENIILESSIVLNELVLLSLYFPFFSSSPLVSSLPCWVFGYAFFVHLYS